MKNLTAAEFAKLQAIELRGKKVVHGMKKWNDENKALAKVRESWHKFVIKLGLDPFGSIAYTCTELNKDFSHGYDFSDAIC